MPGEKVVIEISYVETLKYEDGAYEFVFPMDVGRVIFRAASRMVQRSRRRSRRLVPATIFR